MKLSFIICLLFLCVPSILPGQDTPSRTTADRRMEGYQQRITLKDQSVFGNLAFRNIGPTIFSGRVVDVDVNPANPGEMYVAYASGGLWYTDNHGTTFTPVFDQEACMTIGDIAVNWSAGIIWVGTGENNSSRSSYSGVGIYKSTDKGKTWKHTGLEESHHIGRIILHPINPNIVHVACLGSLYSESTHRGMYHTSDGGVTWRHSLYVNSNAGAIDLVADPSNPNILYCAIWERTRRAWDFTESGEGSGIYKSTNGGRTWELLTGSRSGFPTGKGVGRIGLDIVRNRNETIIYALLDNQDIRPAKEPEEDVLTKAELSTMSSDSFLMLKDEIIKAYLESNRFPEKYTVDTIKTLVKNGTITPNALVEFVQNANASLFDTEVIGAEVYRSSDGGRTWEKTHTDFIDQMYHTYGYYFGEIRSSKLNPQKIYILGVPLLKSEDGGATWKSLGAANVHVDHHALWVNPRQDGHLVLGNDGGLNISFDDGTHWIKCNQPPVGQFYSINVDMAEPYNVYGGLQDNGVWVGPSTYEHSVRWHNSGQYPFKEIMGGDGMQIAIDTRDNNTVYTGFQFGNYFKVKRNGSSRNERITPLHDLGQRPYRWNWETPVHLSIHNQDILYMAAERVFRSMEQGKNFKPISDDLTRGGRQGDVPYGTIVALHESPLKFGLLYTGSDDGYIHVTRDGGNFWKRVSDNLPQQLWVSSVQASAHEESRVYATLNGYRWDHFESYTYVSEDYGDTWNRIARDIPSEPVNVLKEDPVNPDILYIGTDHGLYISLDRGRHSMLMGDMPHAPVHDLVIHPREKEIVVATHGRSFYKANVKHVQQMKHDMAMPLTCFDETVSIRHQPRWGSRSAVWMDYTEPAVLYPVYSSTGGKGILEVYMDSVQLYSGPLEIKKGLSYYEYDLSFDGNKMEDLMTHIKAIDPDSSLKLVEADNGKYYLPPGKYRMKIVLNGHVAEVNLEVKKRPND